MIAFLLISFFFLLIIGVPIAMSLGLASMGGILLLNGGSMVSVGQRMFEGMNSFALLAIPLYTFAGFTMSKGGISKRLMDFSYALVGRFTGGLAHVNVLSSMIFAGISGSAVADTAGVSGMVMPEMVKKGYSKKFTVAVTAISSTIGIVIPPSIPMVVIAGILGLSTGKLFLGGIIPGIMLGIGQIIVSYHLAKREGIQREREPFDIGFILKSAYKSLPALLMPFIIVGTIVSGIVSPTEAGVIAVVYGLIVGGIVYKELKWRDICYAFTETVKTSGRIFIVIGAAKLYTIMLTTAGFDRWVSSTMLGLSTNPTVILIMILLIFFIVTMFMESIATLTLFMPVIYPVALSVGIDPIHLSVLITIMIGVGLATPPVGMCIYVACDLMNMRVGQVMKTLIPYLLVTFIIMGILIVFPQLILWPASLI
ncbi:TRAP transporter, DctM subunit [Clostridium aceticum]|uniref:TRAP transporter, DctM subunit n=1 Tax=Clostridium aceticum TaxID=84022 RepID=A0A0G3WF12_9CLOT|nr:TRAP transporter large permease [Clostridium aceticum]AKL96507.1 TRAP transporter, DctM subunit [Clostridium aceticum]